jgi:hypothetical protein
MQTILIFSWQVLLIRLNVFQIVQDGHSANLFDAMRHRPMGTALITVGNHASSMDDPGLLGKNWLPGHNIITR